MPDYRIRFHPVGPPQRRSAPVACPPAPAGCGRCPTTDSPPDNTCCSENPICSTNTGSNSATAAANAGSSGNNRRPMPAHCDPCPGYTNTTPGPTWPLMRPHHPRRGRPAGQRPQPCDGLPAIGRDTPWRTSHAGTGGDSWCAPPRPTPLPRPAPSIQSANTARHRRHPLRRLARHHQGAHRRLRGRGRNRSHPGACSSTTCALVPPKPNDDTPARRGRPVEANRVSCNDFQTHIIERNVRIRVTRNASSPEYAHAAPPALP